MKTAIFTILTAVALTAPSLHAEKATDLLNLKTDITDSNIIFPESYEVDTQKMLEGWFMKNYTATDDRYQRLGDVAVDDATLKKRLANLPTVIEMPYNSIVRSYIERYTSRGRQQVAALLGLSLYYMPIFEQVLEENKLPLELKYLPVIESGLDPNAVSKHGAGGLWQFMIGTAKGLGLEVSSLIDERRDPYMSSQIAAKYLKDLYSSYGDWSLAIAAYNCGPGTVNKAIRRAGGEPSDHDFWSIYYYLPAETRGYVPQFIAANYVMTYYPEHNISPVLPTKPLVTDTVMVSDRVHFEQISHVLNIPVDELRVLNPQFRANLIPGSPEHPYTLILPSQQCHAYLMSEEEIKEYDADKYLRRVTAEPGSQPAATAEIGIVDDDADNIADAAPEETTTQTSAARQDERPGYHKVKPGESLGSIARAYNVSPEDIKKWNNLSRNAVRTGQQLRVSADKQEAAAAPAQSTPRKDNWVQNSSSKKSSSSGSKNSRSKKSSTKSAAPRTHTVKSGENLTVIAKKYGVSLADLKKSSGIKGDALHPGDKVKLPSNAKGSSYSKSSKGKKHSSSGSRKSKGKKSKSKKRR